MTPHGSLQRSRVASSSLVVTSGRPQRESRRRYELGSPGLCSGRANLTICLFDDSGSVAAPAGNDPLSNRYREASTAFHSLARRCLCGQCRAAVLHFDLVGGCGPTSTRWPLAKALTAALTTPPQAAGASLIGPSLAEVSRLVEQDDGRSDLRLVVFSDFELFDPDADRLLADMARFPGSVHAVVLGTSTRVAFDPVVQVTHLTYGSAPGAAARALLRSLSAGRIGARVPDEPATEDLP